MGLFHQLPITASSILPLFRTVIAAANIRVSQLIGGVQEDIANELNSISPAISLRPIDGLARVLFQDLAGLADTAAGSAIEYALGAELGTAGAGVLGIE